jgi:arginase
VRVVPGAMDAGGLAAQLDGLAVDVRRVYLHVDLDALDVTVGRANPYGGPALEPLLAALEAVFDRFDVAAAALTAYDPRVDAEGGIAAAAHRIAATIARAPPPTLDSAQRLIYQRRTTAERGGT